MNSNTNFPFSAVLGFGPITIEHLRPGERYVDHHNRPCKRGRAAGDLVEVWIYPDSATQARREMRHRSAEGFVDDEKRAGKLRKLEDARRFKGAWR